MPINSFVVEPGRTKIAVGTCRRKDEFGVYVAFGRLTRPIPIGSRIPKTDPSYGKLTDRIIFTNPESIDVTIKQLTKARKLLVAAIDNDMLYGVYIQGLGYVKGRKRCWMSESRKKISTDEYEFTEDESKAKRWATFSAAKRNAKKVGAGAYVVELVKEK